MPVILPCHNKKNGKFATRHRYFLMFSKTHRPIVTLAGAIHIFQNIPHGQKTEILMHFLQTQSQHGHPPIFLFFDHGVFWQDTVERCVLANAIK
jgi:hypothetical protein